MPRAVIHLTCEKCGYTIKIRADYALYPEKWTISLEHLDDDSHQVDIRQTVPDYSEGV